MWVAGEATGLLCTLAVFIAWLRTDERAAKRNDRVTEAAAAAQLAHWRATRDAAARAAGAGFPTRGEANWSARPTSPASAALDTASSPAGAGPDASGVHREVPAISAGPASPAGT
jgi:hypothetical protein